jgi:hypothetical protein
MASTYGKDLRTKQHSRSCCTLPRFGFRLVSTEILEDKRNFRWEESRFLIDDDRNLLQLTTGFRNNDL